MTRQLLREGSWRLKKWLCLYVLYRCVYWLKDYGLLFGENSISPVFPFSGLGPIKNAVYLLYQQHSAYAGYLFLAGAITLSLLILCGKGPRFVPEILLWLIVLNLHNRIYVTITGGDNLLNQLLLFSIFIDDKKSSLQRPIFHLLHNLSVIAIVAQLCLVYGLSAYAKFTDPNWVNGRAVLMVARVDHYSLSFIEQLSYSAPVFFVFMNYLVLAYQTFFPFLIWVRKVKKVFLLIGVGMHLYISLVMGLVSFGLLMILCYSILWPVEDKSEFYY